MSITIRVTREKPTLAWQFFSPRPTTRKLGLTPPL